MAEKTTVLLQWDSNWADEMDIYGFSLMDKEDWSEYKKYLKERKGGFTFYIGTNEEIEYSNGNELLREITVTEISDKEAATVEKLFGGEGGFTDFLTVEDEEEWDDEEDED
jgi:hypothetical protein